MPRDIARTNPFNSWVLIAPFSILGLMCSFILFTGILESKIVLVAVAFSISILVGAVHRSLTNAKD